MLIVNEIFLIETVLVIPCRRVEDRVAELWSEIADVNDYIYGPYD